MSTIDLSGVSADLASALHEGVQRQVIKKQELQEDETFFLLFV
jgi:hypothetical protein